MRFMVFTDKMVDGVAEIDSQHARMIDILNELYAIVIDKDINASLERVFDKLASYMVQHLDYEEALFAETQYPKADEHRAEHESLRRRIADFREASRGNHDIVLASDLLHFLRQWLNDHMLSADKDACRHFNAHGIH
jgi:hemerythrin